MGDPNLVTTCNFHGQEYLFKMNVLCSNLEVLVTDKSSGEEWQCSYDATYVENLTHKTGNFKQFDIFVAMIKSGLLRTSESVSLDLLTFDDLELLRSRKLTKTVGPTNNNRRYLIVTYVVEFDKIRYPLPLEYCGPPDPVVLQGTIRRLELELAKTKEELALKATNSDSRKVYFLQKRVDELTEENLQLQEEIRQVSKLVGKKPKAQVLSLQKAVNNLEKCVVSERNSHHELVEKLRHDKEQISKELEKVKCSERNLKVKLNKVSQQSKSRMAIGDYKRTSLVNKQSSGSLRTMYKKSQSPVCERHPELRKDISRHYMGRHRSTTYACSKSRDSSSSSAKYGDPELLEFPDNLPSRTPSLSPLRNKTYHRSRCSSAGSKTSSRASSRVSRSRRSRKDPEFQKLAKKIAYLEMELKSKSTCDRDK